MDDRAALIWESPNADRVCLSNQPRCCSPLVLVNSASALGLANLLFTVLTEQCLLSCVVRILPRNWPSPNHKQDRGRRRVVFDLLETVCLELLLNLL